MDEKIKKILSEQKPSEPRIPENFASETLKRIKQDKVGMTPMFVFAFKKWGLRVGLGVSLIVSAFFFNAFWYEAKETGTLEFLEFGTSGLGIVLPGLPYDLMIWALAFFAVAEIAISRMDLLYKYRASFVMIGLAVFLATGGVGTALALSTPMNESIQNNIERSEMNMPVLTEFYKERARFREPAENCLIGKVEEVGPETLIVVTPSRRTIRVIIRQEVPPEEFSEPRFKQGDFIKAIGKHQEDAFDPHQLSMPRTKQAQRFFRTIQNVNAAMPVEFPAEPAMP